MDVRLAIILWDVALARLAAPPASGLLGYKSCYPPAACGETGLCASGCRKIVCLCVTRTTRIHTRAALGATLWGLAPCILFSLRNQPFCFSHHKERFELDPLRAARVGVYSAGRRVSGSG